MAIVGPSDLPVVLKADSTPIKNYVLGQLGHPHVNVEMSESQFESALRISGDFIAGYFPARRASMLDPVVALKLG
jgi:ABC-type lipoprotein release transport system permease subunit